VRWGWIFEQLSKSRQETTKKTGKNGRIKNERRKRNTHGTKWNSYCSDHRMRIEM
jgi:hypothetical protein